MDTITWILQGPDSIRPVSSKGGGRVRFQVLGPLSVFDDGSPIEIRGLMPRTVLAVLLLRANTTVAADHLTEVLWGQRPPPSSSASLQNHVMRLRRMLDAAGGERIRTMATGYSLRVEAGELDLDVFTELCASGREAGLARQWDSASTALTAALTLWHGPPVSDIPGLAGQDAQVQLLLEARLRAAEGRFEAELHLGRHDEAIGELRVLAVEHPLREPLHAQLMLALFRAGRQSEALEVFTTLRHTLIEDLGVEPSQLVRELHGRILRADPELAAPTRDPAPASGPVPLVAGGLIRHGTRNQLPPDTRMFTGRGPELEALLRLADGPAGGGGPGIAAISAIDGMGGIGKSALAIRAAHLLRDKYPDGQFFVDLHGHTDGVEPMTAREALDLLLRSLGALPQSIPRDTDERAAAYRGRLDGTRTLIILDDAVSTAQIAPLLPSADGCLVLVTSRRHLSGLDDARHVTLNVLSEDDAVALLYEVAGPGRIPPGDPAAVELTRLCGHLPLAVRIVAARLRHRRALRVEDVVQRLRREDNRLNVLRDEGRDLTAVFDLSYRDLDPAQQRMFRMLSLVPGTDLDLDGAASLADMASDASEHLLDALVDHNLLIHYRPDRYKFHDLIRTFARTLAAGDQVDDRNAAVERLLDHYQDIARATDRQMIRYSRPGPAVDQAATSDIADGGNALPRMRVELPNIMAAVPHARPERVVALATDLACFLQQEGPWHHAVVLHEAAVIAARGLADRLREAGALWDLGRVHSLKSEYEAATGRLELALALYRDLGNGLGEANVLQAIAVIHNTTGENEAAAGALEAALDIAREIGDDLTEANCLLELGRVRISTGDADGATGQLEGALRLYRVAGSRHGEASTLRDLGRVRSLVGDSSAAIELLRQALAIFQDEGNRLGEANTLQDLGREHTAIGNVSSGSAFLQRALTSFREIGERLGQGNSLMELAQLATDRGDPSVAQELLEVAIAIYRDLGARHNEGYALWFLARARIAAKADTDAESLLSKAAVILNDVGDRHGEAEVLRDFGRFQHRAGKPEAARDLLKQSLALFRDVGDQANQADAADAIAALDTGWV